MSTVPLVHLQRIAMILGNLITLCDSIEISTKTQQATCEITGVFCSGEMSVQQET